MNKYCTKYKWFPWQHNLVWSKLLTVLISCPKFVLWKEISSQSVQFLDLFRCSADPGSYKPGKKRKEVEKRGPDETWWQTMRDRSSLAFLSLPPSSPLQTGLGQTAGGAGEKPGHGIYKSLAFCTGQAWRSIKSHILKSKCCFWFPHFSYYLWLWNNVIFVLFQFQVWTTRTVCNRIIGGTLTRLYVSVSWQLFWCLFNFSVEEACPNVLQNELYYMSSTSSLSSSIIYSMFWVADCRASMGHETSSGRL